MSRAIAAARRGKRDGRRRVRMGDDGPAYRPRATSATPEDREMDVLMSTGETVSSTLMVMALHTMGHDAISLSGGQAGIRTDKVHRKARILAIDPKRVHDELEKGRTVIVAGFQGLTQDADEDIATLGRGGSDTTAVALAAAPADAAIYTDVDGATCDPRIVPEARKLDEISYDEMLELASVGAKVLHSRAVEVGGVYNIPILVASSFKEASGTLIHGGVSVEQFKKV
jgi:aspartate kinase